MYVCNTEQKTLGGGNKERIARIELAVIFFYWFGKVRKDFNSRDPVSYTHLTLPTILRV